MSPEADTNREIEEKFRRFGPSYRWFVTVGGLVGSMSMVLSGTMVNVAVPSIMGAFGVGQDLAQWVATAFLTTMVASQLLNSWMVQAFGQRTTYSLALLLFCLGAFVCAAAPNIETLILGRIMQGISAGLIQPLVLATVVMVFPAERRGMAIGVYGMGVTLVPSFGPFVGGLAIDAMSWRDIFFVPLPLVGIAFILGVLFMPAKKLSFKFPTFDWLGYLLVAVALMCVMSAIGNGQRWGWSSDSTLLFFLVGAFAAILFVYTQLRAENPLLDFNVFKDLRFTSAMFIAFAFGAGNFATNYAIPVFAQTVQGFTPTDAGLVLVPAGMLLVALVPLAGRLADTFPSHYPIMAGCIVFSAAAFLLSGTDVNTPYWTIAIFAMLSRSAIGLVMPNMGKVAMSSIPPAKINQGAGTYNFIRQMGGAFGVNLTAVSIEMQTVHHADSLSFTQTYDNLQSIEILELIREILLGGGIPEDTVNQGALDYLATVIYLQAQTFGFQDTFLCICVAFAIAFIPAWILGRTRGNN